MTASSYRRDIDTVPVPDTLAKIPLQADLEKKATTGLHPGLNPGREVDVNILADEYWDLYAALLS